MTPSMDMKGSPASLDRGMRGASPSARASWPWCPGQRCRCGPSFQESHTSPTWSSPGLKSRTPWASENIYSDSVGSFLEPGLAPHPRRWLAACLCPPSAACSTLTDSLGSAPPIWALTPPGPPQGVCPACGVSGVTRSTPSCPPLSAMWTLALSSSGGSQATVLLPPHLMASLPTLSPLPSPLVVT